MNPRIEKLKAEREKLAMKYNAMGMRLKALDETILKLENTDIVGIVRETGLSIDQLARLMELQEQNPTAPMREVLQKSEGEIQHDD